MSDEERHRHHSSGGHHSADGHSDSSHYSSSHSSGRHLMGSHYLTRIDCSAMRGMAIIGIFLHNYCHWLKGVVRENEYTFNMKNVDGMYGALSSLDHDMLLHLLSFFGHYGVPLFVFLSGYGLVLKYERNAQEAKKNIMSIKLVSQFVGTHFVKLFKMMLIGFVAFTMVDMMTPGTHKYPVANIVSQLFMVNNLAPDPDRVIWPGPYWFFGLMLQLYVLYRLLLYRRHWSVVVTMMVACMAVQMVFEPTSSLLNWLRYNFVGNMLPFGLGILAGRYEYKMKHLHRVFYVWVLIFSVALVWLLSMYHLSWFWVPVFVITGAIAVVKLLPKAGLQLLGWMGGISAALFICHPILRKIFIPMSMHGQVYSGLLLYVISSVCVAWVFKILLDRMMTNNR